MTPDLFVVGAPKCGTTTLHAALRAHPQVFMPRCKEPHFFGSDLYGDWFVRDRAAYDALFAPAPRYNARRIGEASVFYLYSRLAACEIRAASPDARIVVALRDPVAVMHALHAQLHYNGNEDIADFARALDAEVGRRGTRQAPNRHYPPEVLWYREVVRFADQLTRYLDVFGRERVHIVLHDDLARRPEATLRALLSWLDLDPGARSTVPHANRARSIRSARLHRWLMAPPPQLRRAVHAALPGPARASIVRAVVAVNTRRAARAPIPVDLERRLRAELAPDVARLGRLIDRDLSAWSAPRG